MTANSEGSTPKHVSEFVRAAIARMHAAPLSYFTPEQVKALEEIDRYDGPIMRDNPKASLLEPRILPAKGQDLPSRADETSLSSLEIHDMAADLFATKEAASAWLREPHPMLDNERPLDAAKTSAGAEAVKNLLMSAKYGGAG